MVVWVVTRVIAGSRLTYSNSKHDARNAAVMWKARWEVVVVVAHVKVPD